MKVHTLSQSQVDGDLYVMQLNKHPLTLLYGQITANSSLLRYLPRNYEEYAKHEGP